MPNPILYEDYVDIIDMAEARGVIYPRRKWVADLRRSDDDAGWEAAGPQ
jgi:hypothetical protein